MFTFCVFNLSNLLVAGVFQANSENPTREISLI